MNTQNQQHDNNNPNTMTNNNEHPLLCADYIYHILKYLDAKFIFGVCVRVAKEWNEVATLCSQLPLSLSERITPDNLQSVVQSIIPNNNLRHLKRLHLEGEQNVRITLEQLTAITNSYQHLTSLTITKSYIIPQGAKCIANCKALNNLTYLDLSDNVIADDGVEFIVSSPHLKLLRHLNVSSNYIKSKGCQAITESEHLKSLEHLDLANNFDSEQGDECAKILASVKTSCNLKRLNLNSNSIGAKGTEHIAKSDKLTINLTNLDLSENLIEDKGVQHLAGSNNLKGLRSLNVRGNCISNVGVESIAKSVHLNELVDLNLSDNSDIDNDAAICILYSRTLCRLRQLNFTSTGVTEEMQVIFFKILQTRKRTRVKIE
ncbi:hypothetical protein C9374_002472 [Naegleria lovaniensis]|uniref:Uncharacterized protein n=1 Tax=Naegleria lovaniensis TaxID=51637 RepID=A0AA88GVJ8_NAELO|nr:uncharacterized protein C9374_002472 [Naegleria lovaniensis]KAG2386728.1 hypothetical protein C9374_002472 [Naegleria lovaniensis]